MNINKESLEIAIKEFNDYYGAARIYIDTSDGEFETSIYASDLHMNGSFSEDEYIAVYSKTEVEGNKRIADKRRSYILRFVELIAEGYNLMQAEDKLLDEFPMI